MPVLKTLKKWFDILKKTFKAWNADDPFRQSAIIAYYAIFSLPALLAIIVSTAGLVFGADAVRGEISEQTSSVMGAETAQQVEAMIVKASETKKSIIATIIGFATLIFGATGVFTQFQKSLNLIWEVKAAPKKPFIKSMKDRLFSFGLIISIGFLMLISLVVTSALTAMSNWIKAYLPDITFYLFYLLNFIISFSIITVLFALMFKVLPDVRIRWRDVWTGGILTALLFMLGKFGLGIYFGKADPASAYGAAGSIILILLWVSYSSMIVFFGAEFTKQYSLAHGRKIIPTKGAIKLDDSDDIDVMQRKGDKLEQEGSDREVA